MPLLLRPWPLLLLLALSACAGSVAGPSADGCAAEAAELSRRMAGSGIVLPGGEPGRPELIAALRFANFRLALSQEAATSLFECRSAQARRVREDQAAGRIWRLTAEFRIARIRAALREEIEGAIEDSEDIRAADAALIAAASTRLGEAGDRRLAAEQRSLIATNEARRESFGATVLLAGQITDIEMDRVEASR